jgi:hypothetical protein
MRKISGVLLVLPALLVLVPGRGAASDLSDLLRYMTGSFSSTAQAEADSAYLDIRLEMVRIWPDRTDGAWLYVEQAAGDALHRPYRQRVYRVTEEIDGGFRSEVFELPEPKEFVGAWGEPDRFDGLGPRMLLPRRGCAVHLARAEDRAFVGGTEGSACSSELQGASYATSEVTITADRLVSWDRGFDEEGNQVWGATAGPYVFRRVTYGDD